MSKNNTVRQKTELIIYKCYKITNLVNNKIYIGQTKFSLNRRLKAHFNKARKGCKYYLHNAIRKYGIENFKIELLFELSTKEECNKKEIDLINKYESMSKDIGYNMCKGGSGGDLLSNHPNKKEILKKKGMSIKKFYNNNEQARKQRSDEMKNHINSLSDIEKEERNEKLRFYSKYRNYNHGDDHHNYKDIDLYKLKFLKRFFKRRELLRIFKISKPTYYKRLKLIESLGI